MLGNHDLHYSEYPNYKSSGFKVNIQPELTDLFKSNAQLFDIANQVDDWIFSHAGISNQFLNSLEKISPNINKSNATLAQSFNELHRDPLLQKNLHIIGKFRGGNHKCGGITWADKQETEIDYLNGMHQVVGHTCLTHMVKIENSSGSSITYINVLDTIVKFFEVEI